MNAAVWFVSIERPGLRAEWDCQKLGPPDPRDLLPTRRPASGDFSRHVPRRAFSVTTGGSVDVESGLEHDLLRWLDLRADVTWMVGQPVVLHFPVDERSRAVFHVPDLLSQQSDGSVTVWDVRPESGIDARFSLEADLTDTACRNVGWDYETFTGLPTPTRMNLLWLSGYRRPMPWHQSASRHLRSLLGGRTFSTREIRAADDGTGKLVSTAWHLIAVGSITCDLSRPIRQDTPLNWSAPHDPGSHRSGRPKDEPAPAMCSLWTPIPRPGFEANRP